MEILPIRNTADMYAKAHIIPFEVQFMVRIGNTWHWEPSKVAFCGMQAKKMIVVKGVDAKGKTRQEPNDLIIEHYGDSPIPVPNHILISVR